jgi:hypothetical protein
MIKSKLTCFTEDFAKLHKTNPGPHAKYSINGADWLTTFQKHRGPFLKKQRTLFTEEHMNTVKAKPGPNKYLKGNFGHTPVKPLGCYKK